MPGARRKKADRDRDPLIDPKPGDLVEGVGARDGVQQLRVEALEGTRVELTRMREDGVEIARVWVELIHYRAECIRVRARVLKKAGG